MPTHDSKTPQKTIVMGCLVRLYWMGVGNIVLFFSAIKIAQRNSGQFLSELDAVFWSAIFSLLMFRYIDIKYFHGSTSTGEPATMVDFKKYAIGFVVGGAAAWGLAHGVATFLNAH